MKIGDEYDIPLIGSSEWHALASACALDSALLMSRVRQLADALPGAVSAARDQASLMPGSRSSHHLAELLIQHANARRATLNAAGSNTADHVKSRAWVTAAAG